LLRNEYRTKQHGLSDLLLPFALIEDGILLQSDGSLLAGWKFSGPDLMSATPDEMAALRAQLNSVLKLGDGWMIGCDSIRSQAPGYPPEGAFPDAITRLIDAERRQQFTQEGAHFECEHFLTLTWLPPAENEERARGWFFDGPEKHTSSRAAAQAVERFKTALDRFENVFGHLFRIERLKCVKVTDYEGFQWNFDELLRYMRRCVTGEDYPFALPDIPVDLNELLAVEDFVGGIAPQMGDKRLAIIAVEGFPKASYPGMLAALDQLEIPYRWNTRAILLDPPQASALLDKLRKKWKSKVRGFKDQVMNSAGGRINYNAAEMAADAEAAMAEADSGDVQFLQYTSTIVCLDSDLARLRDSVRRIQKTIQNLGFAARLETVNAVEAWRGSIPGDGYSNVRRVLLHTMNLADMLPIASVWPGEKRNPSPLMPPYSPPLMLAATSGATPFRLNLHVSDVGHAFVVGPSGAGKSTLLAALTAQWFRYPNAQVFALDKGYSLWALCAAAGGEFYDLAGPKTDLSFCPLRQIDSDSDRQWAANWVEVLCELNGLKFTPRHKNALSDAFTRLRQSPTRTLTELRADLQDAEIREALQHYTIAGPMGSLLDAESDGLDDGSAARFITFELENLMQLDAKVQIPVLLYLFRRIEQRLDGSPTLITIDEAWASLQNPVFAARLKDWLKTMRRKNAAVVLATQQVGDIARSDIADVVLEQCPTRFLLPNPQANTTGSTDHPGPRDFYERLGLNSREIEILQNAVPKRQYYVFSPLGRRLIDLGLGKVALSFAGVNGAEERGRLEKVMRQYPDSWREEWLRLRGLPDWGDYLAMQAPTAQNERVMSLCA
jgi:type IV secretion/conjugal transfer VirB4 family ATPase